MPLTPPVATGAYPELGTLPTVTIGGATVTTVAYAGPIPGSMLGLLQLNVVVPVGASPGKAVPLNVTVRNARKRRPMWPSPSTRSTQTKVACTHPHSVNGGTGSSVKV